MATFSALVAGVWAFLKAVPPAVYTHGGAFLFGLMFRWIIAVALALALVGGSLAGEPCKCGPGCAAGGNCSPCLCAAADPQRAAYDALVRRLKPGQLFQVFVNADPAGSYVPAVRWDGYPGVKGRWVITGSIAADGQPYEYDRFNLDAPQRGPEPIGPPQPARRFNFVTAPFGGGCPGGNCRSR